MGIDLASDLPSQDFISKIDKLGPYVLYMGRVDHAKLVNVLIENFINFVALHKNSSVKLILAGGKDPNLTVPDHPQIQYLGFVTEAEKILLIKQSLGMINPSAFESLSIIIAEAMALKVPVLVNGFSEVLRDYQLLAKSVFVYANPEEFHKRLGEMINFGSSEADRMELDQGSAAIDNLFNWKNIVKTYETQVRTIVSTRESK